MSQKRSIFEEVSSEAAATKAAPTPGLIDKGKDGARRAVRLWLLVLFFLVFLMIIVGGLTRLTDSGLSITEWAPVTGAIPPLSAADWDLEFEKYRAIPEYQLQNKGMSLAEFKVIYWWEWGHRQLGRVIGLVWALGFLFFLVTRKIPTGWTGRLLLLGVLGGTQGAIGWWMVSSGLTGTMLDVASYRLATHLGLAFVILGLIAVYMFALKRPERELMQARRTREAGLSGMAALLVGVTFVQILIGALVAGIDAGRSYTEWPLMGGAFLPPSMWDLEPIWRNFFENAGTVQFVHRVWGYLAFALAIAVWLAARRSSFDKTKSTGTFMLAIFFVQIALGIITVLHAAPWYLAIVHQIVAVKLWVLILRLRHLARYPIAQSIRGTSA
ncbi:MAG: heme A synthase [Pseudomonadota bacterium]